MALDRKYLIDRQGKQYVLYAGLLDLAHQLSEGRLRIATSVVQVPSAANGQVAICAATAGLYAADEVGGGLLRETSGIGDASPANVARGMETAIIRLAETRAKARALRDLVNVAEAVDDADDGAPPLLGVASDTPPAPSRIPAIRRRDALQPAPEGGAPIDQRAALLVRYRKLAARALAAGVAVDDVPVLHDDAPAEVITAAGKALQERVAAAAPAAG